MKSKIILINLFISISLLTACSNEIDKKEEEKNMRDDIVGEYIMKTKNFYNMEIVEDEMYIKFIKSDNYEKLKEFNKFNKEVYNEIIKSMLADELNKMEYDMILKEYDKYIFKADNEYEKQLLNLLLKQRDSILLYFNHNNEFFNTSELTNEKKSEIIDYKKQNMNIEDYMRNYYINLYEIESYLKNKELISIIDKTPVKELEESINKKIYNIIRASTIGYDFINLTQNSVVSNVNEKKIESYLGFIELYLKELNKLELNEEIDKLKIKEIEEVSNFINLVNELYTDDISLERKNEIKELLNINN